MKGLLITTIVVLALLLLSLVRLGGQASYSKDGFTVKLIIGPFRFLLYPRPQKKTKTKADRHPAKKNKSELKGGTVELFKAFLPLLLEAVGYLKQKVRIDHIRFWLTVAAGDPASAALAFGSANALLGMLWPPIENNFNIKERDIRTDVDFQGDQPRLLVDAAFTMTLGQIVAFGLRYGVAALKRYRTYKKTHSADRKADLYGKEPSHQ